MKASHYIERFPKELQKKWRIQLRSTSMKDTGTNTCSIDQVSNSIISSGNSNSKLEEILSQILQESEKFDIF